MFKKFLLSLTRLPGLSCRRAMRLAAKAMDTGLSLGESAERFAHTLICSSCRNYGKQIRLLRAWLRSMDSHPDTRVVLPPAAAKRIKAKLGE